MTLWVAESMVQEVSVWLDADLPEDWPPALAAKAERCFARHRQFHRLISSNGDGGNAGIANLRKFMRHWLASWLKRARPALFRRLPWSYALGTAPGSRRIGGGVVDRGGSAPAKPPTPAPTPPK